MTPYQSQAPEEKVLVPSVQRGSLRGIDVENCHATAMRYIFVFDSLSATGNIICSPIPVAPGQIVALDFEPRGRFFTTGLYLAASSSQTAYVATTANDVYYHADVRGG